MHIYYFFFNDTATTEIYTLSYTTLFRSVVPGGDRGAEPELAAVERMLAQQRAQQRGFSRPVASDDSHHAGSLQRAAESLHQGARADRHAHVLGSHHLIAAPFGHLEPQRHRAVGSR